MTSIIIDTKNHKAWSDTQATICTETHNVWHNTHYVNSRQTAFDVKKIFQVKECILTGAGWYADIENARNLLISDGYISDDNVKSLNFIPSTIVILIKFYGNTVEYYSIQSEVITRKFLPNYRITTLKRIDEVHKNWFFGYITAGSGSSVTKPIVLATGDCELAIKTAARVDVFTNEYVECVDYGKIFNVK